MGSFLNLLGKRLPKGEDVIHGRSHCDFCKKPLRWFELIPLVSFLLQGGTCRRCHKNLSWGHPIVEAITAVGTALIVGMHTSPLVFVPWLLLYYASIVIVIADLQYYIIPDSMIAVGVISAIVLMRQYSYGDVGVHIGASLGAFAVFFLLWLITHGRGMGFGDVKLAGLMGLLLGYPLTIIALYIAFLTGAGVGVILMIGKKKTLKSRVPFGPFLILGTTVTLLWQNALLAFWNGIFF